MQCLQYYTIINSISRYDLYSNENRKVLLTEQTAHYNFTQYYFLSDVKVHINLKYFLFNINRLEFNIVDKRMHMVWYIFIPRYSVKCVCIWLQSNTTVSTKADESWAKFCLHVWWSQQQEGQGFAWCLCTGVHILGWIWFKNPRRQTTSNTFKQNYENCPFIHLGKCFFL